MKDLQTLTHDELLREFLAAHDKYMAACKDFHIYLPKTAAHIKAQIYLDQVLDEINSRKKNKSGGA